MTCKPIIFSAPMVRAILAGRKSQTRRLLRFPAWALENGEPLPVALVSLAEVGGCAYYNEGVPRKTMTLRWAVGDRLWVKETWAVPGTVPRSDDPVREGMRVVYRADGIEGGRTWRPSIYMPRWASRITLEVTAVRVERLLAITPEDAIAEGIMNQAPIAEFSELWDGINSKRATWASNPWVAVVSFKRVQP